MVLNQTTQLAQIVPNLITQKGVELRQYFDTGLSNKIPNVMFKGCFFLYSS
jgi:hypothetical protein